MSTESTERIEKRAGEWLARRDSESWSQEEQAAFDQWLDESTEHRVAWLRLENAWEQALRLKALGAGIHSDKPPAPGEWEQSPFFTQRAEAGRTGERQGGLRFRALAASLIIAVAIASGWYLWPSGTTYETPVGGIASLPLSDGSKVILNTNSEIKVAFTERERRIELTHGEAFFDVAKDPARRFIVTAGDKRVVTVGTAFAVRRDREKGEEQIQVVVTHGAVRFESANAQGVEAIVPRRLDAGSVARANRGGLMVQTKELPELEEQLSWRTGVLVFRDVTLAEAAAEFNRYNDRKIIIEDPAVAELRVAGNFRATNIDAFVRLLEQAYPVRTDLHEQEIVVRAR